MTDGPDRVERTDIELDEREQLVLSTVARMEAEERATWASDVAREAGLDEDAAREALHALSTRHKLVREVADDAGPTDLGPQYELRQLD